MSLKIYDAATAGTQLYAETIGNVTVDANGVYGFQFGAGGSSNTLVTETIATTDGTTLTFQKALGNTPIVAGTVSVTDGTYNWNETTGNPGSPASATATIVSGFVVGASVTSGGSGYSYLHPPSPSPATATVPPLRQPSPTVPSPRSTSPTSAAATPQARPSPSPRHPRPSPSTIPAAPSPPPTPPRPPQEPPSTQPTAIPPAGSQVRWAQGRKNGSN